MSLKQIDRIDHGWGQLSSFKQGFGTKKFSEELKHDLKVLAPVAEKMAQHIHDNKFPSVLVGGTTAQSAAYMVKEAWKKIYGNEKMPKFLTIPRTTNTSSAAQLMSPNIAGLFAPEINKALVNSFVKRYSNLSLAEKEKVFILEEFIDSGRTINRLKSFAKRAGFKKVSAGSLSYGLESVKQEVDFSGVRSSKLSRVWPSFYRFRRDISSGLLEYRLIRKRGLLESEKLNAIKNAKRDHSALRAMRRLMRRSIK